MTIKLKIILISQMNCLRRAVPSQDIYLDASIAEDTGCGQTVIR